MNDSSTIYISHSDDMTHESSMLVPSSTADTSTLSKKVAQNRAAQRAFRERKQHYVEDLENKAKQLDECKRAMIQLQADNACLRKSVARLEGQLKQCLVANSTLVKPTPPLHPLLPSPSPSLTNRLTAPPPPSSSPPHPSSIAPLLQAKPSSLSLSPPASSSSLSKREKKRQRLLAEEKLHKNDDLEPIQLHCPLAPSYHPYQQQEEEEEEEEVPVFIPTTAPNPIRFLQLLPTTGMNDIQDQYIHFVEDNNNHHPSPSQ